jgi:predicted DNA binding CopG/RHH family protein
MKKSTNSKSVRTVSPEEAIEFLENLRNLHAQIDEPTVAISLRVPGNLLKAVKLKAKSDGMKYQSLMVEYIRRGILQ